MFREGVGVAKLVLGVYRMGLLVVFAVCAEGWLDAIDGYERVK